MWNKQIFHLKNQSFNVVQQCVVSGRHTSPDDPDDILTDYGPKLVTAITDNFWFPAGWLTTFISIWCFLEPPGSVSWLFVMTDDIWSSAFNTLLTLAQIKHGAFAWNSNCVWRRGWSRIRHQHANKATYILSSLHLWDQSSAVIPGLHQEMAPHPIKNTV